MRRNTIHFNTLFRKFPTLALHTQAEYREAVAWRERLARPEVTVRDPDYCEVLNILIDAYEAAHSTDDDVFPTDEGEDDSLDPVARLQAEIDAADREALEAMEAASPRAPAVDPADPGAPLRQPSGEDDPGVAEPPMEGWPPAVEGHATPREAASPEPPAIAPPGESTLGAAAAGRKGRR
jgi:hypothetical protein